MAYINNITRFRFENLDKNSNENENQSEDEIEIIDSQQTANGGFTLLDKKRENRNKKESNESNESNEIVGGNPDKLQDVVVPFALAYQQRELVQKNENRKRAKSPTVIGGDLFDDLFFRLGSEKKTKHKKLVE